MKISSGKNMPQKESKGKRPKLLSPMAPHLLRWDPMVLDIPVGERSVMVRKAQEIIQRVLLQKKHPHISSKEKKPNPSREGRFDILQNSVLQACQSRFQAAGKSLDLVQNRQRAIESLIRVRDHLVKHIEYFKNTHDLAQGVAPMEIDSISPIPNYLANTVANIGSGTLDVQQVASYSAAVPSSIPRWAECMEVEHIYQSHCV